MAILASVWLIGALSLAASDRLAMADRLFNRGEYAAAKAEYQALAGEGEIAADRLAFRRIYCDYQLGERAAVRQAGEKFLKAYPASENAADVRFFRAMMAEGDERLRELKALDADDVPTPRRVSVLCELGKLASDARALERALELEPQGPLAGHAKYYHALILAAAKDAKAHRRAICELLEVAFGPDKALGENALYSAVALSYSDQRYGEAVSLVRQYLRRFTGTAARLRQLRSIAAVSEYNSGKYSSAIDFCGEEAGEEFVMIRALAYDRYGDREKSLAAARQYLERYPQGAHRAEIELLLARADFAAAEREADAKRLLEAARRAADLSHSAGDCLRYAWALEKASETERAESTYESVAVKFPKTAEAAEALYRRGLSLARREQWAAAEVAFSEALDNPSLAADRRALASYWSGVACVRLGHAAKAEHRLRAALAAKLPPDEEREAKLMLADADFAAGRREAAVAAYSELLRSGAAERMSAAKTHAVGKLVDPAAAKICAAALAKSTSAEWRQAGYGLLGDAEERSGNVAAAMVAWEQALAEKCTTEAAASAALKLGLAEVAGGKATAAEAHLTQAVKLNSRDGEARAQAYLGLARCALLRQQIEEARKYATVVVTLFEQSPSAAAAGEILKQSAK